MFSRSRKTAMVASVEGLGMSGLYLLESEPRIIEAHADALAGAEERRDLVAHPALEQHQLARAHGQGDPGLRLRARLERWSRHEALEPRILELDARRARRRCEVER